jgi:hypothetical protein
MGFGKYTKDERMIVEEINKLLKSRYWHECCADKATEKVNQLINDLSGKYQRKQN